MITGANAPLGRAVIAALLARDDVSLVLAVGASGQEPPAPDPRLVYRVIDLTRPRAVHDLVWGEARQLGIDRVLHGIHHRRAYDRGRAVHRQNVESTRELLRACLEHPTIYRFVYRSFAEVYRFDHRTANMVDESEALDFEPTSSQWVRDRVEADLDVCAHFGGSLSIAVLRYAEIFAPNIGSQLWDYVQSRVCLRPLGFDPMINVLSLDDAVAAAVAALASDAVGVFNIPGADTLPLSRAIMESRRLDIPVPGPLMAPLYQLRGSVTGLEFRYDINLRRFHFGGVVDGTRARRELGYEPKHHVAWPQPWWEVFAQRVGASR
ncbi:MAG: NAD-dependent epimerase/dehydratase family protein [Kofleriaceae bacterium]